MGPCGARHEATAQLGRSWASMSWDLKQETLGVPSRRVGPVPDLGTRTWAARGVGWASLATRLPCVRLAQPDAFEGFEGVSRRSLRRVCIKRCTMRHPPKESWANVDSMASWMTILSEDRGDELHFHVTESQSGAPL